MSGEPEMMFNDYDERYPLVFKSLVDAIHTVRTDVRVEHVGSTAIPGLGGRGVIDAVVIAPEDRESIVSELLDAGFTRSPHAWIEPTLTRTLEVEGASYPVHLYVLPDDHPVVRGWLAVRDHLRKHPEEAADYARVKRQAIADGHVQPWTYQQAKTPYLEQLAQQLN